LRWELSTDVLHLAEACGRQPVGHQQAQQQSKENHTRTRLLWFLTFAALLVYGLAQPGLAAQDKGNPQEDAMGFTGN
jgi:hypothetical protein